MRLRLRTHLECRSPKCAAYPVEKGEVNGKRLAEYLRDGLKTEGIQTGEIYSERLRMGRSRRTPAGSSMDWMWALSGASRWLPCFYRAFDKQPGGRMS
jgi:hypothetical protein